MLNNLGLIDTKSSFSLSSKENSHLNTNYFRVENFGFLKLTSNEQYARTWYPTPDVIVEAGWFTLDIHNSISGDFNNDGLMDLVFQPMLFPHVVEHKSQIKPIFLFQNSSGGFSDPLSILENSSFPDKHFLYRLGSGDFNNDGVLDVVFSSMGMWSHNTGETNYQTPLAVFGGNEPKLAWTDTFDNLSLWRGSPNWQLGYGTGHSMAVGDFNKDGYSDWFSQWYVSYGGSNNKFNAQVVTPNDLASKEISPWKSQWSWPTVNATVAADLNEDGYDDLVVSTMPNPSSEVNGGDLWLLFGSSTGLRGSSTTRSINRFNDIPGNVGTNFIVAQDFNGDGHIDLIYLEHYWTTDSGDSTYYYSKAKLKLLLGDGTGNFKDQSDLIKDPHSGHRKGEGNIHAMDVNGDGWIDLVLTGYDVDTKDIWLSGQTNEKSSIFLNVKGQLQYIDPKVLAFVSPYQFAGEESIKPWVNDKVGKLVPIDIGADGLIDFIGFVSTPLHSWPQTEQTYTYAYVSRAIKPLGRDLVNESLEGTMNSDKIWGYDGNDQLIGKKGNDILDGGSGIDTGIYVGKRNEYSFNLDKSNTRVIDSVSTRDGTDTLTNIERLKFSDTNIALDIGPAQNAGSLYMLYKAAFNRAPDAGGMGYWLAQVDGGKNIVTDIAAGFVKTPEFVAKYGTNPTNAFYVDQLYLNVLGRVGEAGGVAYWNAELNAGNRNKAEVLVQFATLPEGAALVADLIANGIPYQE